MKYGVSRAKSVGWKTLAALVCIVGSSASALAQEPTEGEWLAWPDFCKAGYLSSQYAEESRFVGRMAEDQRLGIRRSHASAVGIPGVHHFCMGMVYTNRVKAKGLRSTSDYTLKKAIGEINYSFARMSTAAPRYSLVTAYYGTALYYSGKRQQAIDIWNKGIAVKPGSRESYLAMAEVLLAEKKPKEALEVLLRYENAKEGDAPDAEAFLAHTYFELGMYEKAREHADRAYQLGYPFPGLRNKLERVRK